MPPLCPTHGPKLPLPKNAAASEHRLRAHGAQPPQTPHRHPKPAFSGTQTDALRKHFSTRQVATIYKTHWPQGNLKPLRSAPSRGFSPTAPTAANLRCSPYPMRDASTSTPLPSTRFGISKVATACSAPHPSESPCARYALPDLKMCFAFHPPAGQPDLPPDVSHLRFPLPPPASAKRAVSACFADHNFRFRHATTSLTPALRGRRVKRRTPRQKPSR